MILDSRVNPREIECWIVTLKEKIGAARRKLVEMRGWEKRHPERRRTFETALRFAGVEDSLKRWGRRLNRLRQARRGEVILLMQRISDCMTGAPLSLDEATHRHIAGL